jgi:PHP family Zn ribbon phosphoesterase
MMQQYKADLHIHTALSPCADLSMSPAAIVQTAKERGLHLIGIADHNSTLNALVVKRLAAKEGIAVLTGVEVTTVEEVHCLAFFEHESQLLDFQQYLEGKILRIANPDGQLGDQPVVDVEENIVAMIPYWLTAALQSGISAIQQKIFALNGMFIPAHINRPANGLFAQLGFIPPDLQFDALEFTGRTTAQAVRAAYHLGPELTLISNSDAHFPEHIGASHSVFYMKDCSFAEIHKALRQQEGRSVQTK